MAIAGLVFSQCFYVLAHSLVKFGNAFLSLPLLLMARFGVSAVILMAIHGLVWCRDGITEKTEDLPTSPNIKLLIFRAVMGLTAMSLYFYALRIGPLGRGNLIFSLGVLWTYLFSVIGKQEKATWRRSLGFLVALLGLGVLFSVRGAGGNLYADLAALVGSICSGFVMITIKALRRNHSSRMVVTWFYGVGAILLLPFLSFQGVIWTWPLLFLILGIGISGLLAQWIMTESFKSVPGSVASSMNLLGTPMMMVSGVLFFAESFQSLELLGAIGIMLGLVGIVLQKKQAS